MKIHIFCLLVLLGCLSWHSEARRRKAKSVSPTFLHFYVNLPTYFYRQSKLRTSFWSTLVLRDFQVIKTSSMVCQSARLSLTAHIKSWMGLTNLRPISQNTQTTKLLSPTWWMMVLGRQLSRLIGTSAKIWYRKRENFIPGRKASLKICHNNVRSRKERDIE